MTLLSWNLHKMTRDIPAPAFVTEALLHEKADVICLVEYVHDPGIVQALEPDYLITESIPLSGNQVLIAVKRSLTAALAVVDDREIPGCWNFLHVEFTAADGVTCAVLGVRRIVPGKADEQVPPLLSRLQGLKTPFLCAGDFNILSSRMADWFPGIRKVPPLVRSGFSYVFTAPQTHLVTGTGVLDHLLCSDDLEIRMHYSWDFIRYSTAYPPFPPADRSRWNIPAGNPDHAMLLAEIQ